MQLENTFVVPVPVDEAWRTLLDVERVAPCMPGAELESVDGDDFTGRVKVKVGPITITYRGKARFVSRDDTAHEAVLEASGKETRGAGTAKATIRTRLVDRGTETEVRVTTDLAVTGKPAQFGRGVLAEVSGKLIDQFAGCLADEVRGGSAPAAGAEPAAAAPTAETSPEAAAGDVPTGAPVVTGTGDAAAAPAAAAPAAPPLPPTGAPQEAAPAPATPIGDEAAAAAATARAATASDSGVRASGAPAAWDGAPGTSGRPGGAPRRPAEPINLLETAGAPIAKRVLPAVAALLVLYVVVRVIRRK